MSLVTDHTPIPLAPDADGGIRVGGTRVTLETLVAVFMAGATAEEIVQRYPSLDLGDVYLVIGFYLHHREEVEEYLRRRQAQGRQARNRQEVRFNQSGLRERLLARRAHSLA
ncbi:MAG TPA: DUF433 domain-containing protein [Chloroflexota bacterium]|nr:DUF433 domain-containing protein [Chloroflexota bacterium]